MLKTEESLLNAQLYVLRYNALKTGLVQRQQKISTLEIELEKAIAEQRQTEAEIENRRKQLSERTDQVNRMQERFYQLGAEITRTEESLQFNQQRIEQLNEELSQTQHRSLKASHQVESDDQQIQTMQAQVAKLQPRAAVLATADESQQNALAEAETQNKDWQHRWDAFNQEFAANEQGVQVQTSKIEYLDQLITRLQNRFEELARMVSEQPKEEGQMFEQMALEIDGLVTQSRSLEDLMAECRDSLVVAKASAQSLEATVEKARTQVQQLRQQAANLQALQDAALSLNVPEAETRISDNGLSDAKRLGQNLSVVPGWESAVESVMGRFMQALQVEDLANFADTLSELCEGDLALVESSTQQTEQPSSEALHLPTLRSLLRADALAGSSLLHGVYAAESAEVALAKRQALQSGESIITREGFWAGSDWIRALHDEDQSQGIIERGQAIEALTLRTEDADNYLAQLLTQLQGVRAHVEALETKREELQGQANALNQNLSDRRTSHSVTQVKLEEAAARQEQNLQEMEELRKQIAEEKARQDQARAALSDAEGRRSDQDAVKRDLREERDLLAERLQQTRDSARQSRDEFHAVDVQLESLQSQLKVSVSARERMLSQQAQLAEQLQNIQQGITDGRHPIP